MTEERENINDSDRVLNSCFLFFLSLQKRTDKSINEVPPIRSIDKSSSIGKVLPIPIPSKDKS